MKKTLLMLLKIGLSIFIFMIVFYTEKQMTMGEDSIILASAIGFGFFMSLNSVTKKYLVILSAICFIVMAIFYLFWGIIIASWIGSIGFIYLTFYVLGNLKDLIKEGYIQKMEN